MSKLLFRDSKLIDLESIVAIYNSTVSSRLVTADTHPVSIESKEAWFYAHSSDKRPLWVVENESDGALVGWVSFQSFYGRPAYDGTVEISIYLHENQRGKGHGKAILQYCLHRAPDYGIDTLLAYIFAHNTPSIALFEKFHFSEWAHLPDIAVLDGQRRSLKILGIHL
ncbi:N-acetyltransferase family protein [Sphingobacterium sp. lm-10]|uniref:GNAT family N-acetyltransferase n=1 Tax=Sphingobacterium sp. lm-10 TaxID=2944904 RepID=UPI0020220573|nr:GNAT family N-acetyltransferase [Sphingobacterium sp. lm-10]MCL7986902.1 N-acetyltransferase family protein [Sphingobacterium sp. lm-10]